MQINVSAAALAELKNVDLPEHYGIRIDAEMGGG